VARGGCLFAWYFIVTRSNVLTERSYSLLAYRLKIPPAKNRAEHYVFMKLVQPFRHCCKRHCNWLLAIAYSTAALCSWISSTSLKRCPRIDDFILRKSIYNTGRIQATREDGGTQPFINGQQFLYWRSNERCRITVVNQPVLIPPLSSRFPSVLIHTDLLKPTGNVADS
jgi:hypothetical protein